MNAVQTVKQEHLARAPESTSRTFVVYGPKGGLGKTTLAFNLAVAMAQLPGLRVALVDGSLQFGDIRALLRVPDSAPSMLQLPTDRVSEADLEQVVWRDPSGIDILLAPPRIEMAEMVTVARHGEDTVAAEAGLQRGGHRHAHGGRPTWSWRTSTPATSSSRW